MKLKTYQARTMSEALAKVKKDLGADAVILHTRTIRRGGVLGVGARPIIEITATPDTRAARVRSAGQPNSETVTPTGESLVRNVAMAQTAVKAYAASKTPSGADAKPGSAPPVRGKRMVMRGLETPESSPQGAKSQSAASAPTSLDVPMPPEVRTDVAIDVDPGLRREIEEIRAMVRSLVDRSDRSAFPEAPEALVSFYSHLVAQDVEEQLARELLSRAARNLGIRPGRRVANELVRMELGKLVGDMLPIAAPLRLKSEGGPTVVALVGPTGVGKTTTIAKLAANMKLRERKSVGLVTIDSYRIAAVEQLKTYAQILKVPLVSVLTPDDLRAAIERMSSMDLILIDTAGRSQKDDPRIAELSAFLRAAAPDQVHLVLSSTSRERTTRDAIEKFRPLGVTQLIFTKVDEAVGLGVILNTLRRVNMRVSYLTTGQAVPDDIEVAGPRRLASLILGFPTDRPRAVTDVSTPAACPEVLA